ncbi:MAG: SDR family oxidoreductase [Zoogloeaceae bacterium]|jgi:NAD(P)-dependent dehydrogenase (short-subunit alcohol dehydrogenase family)|nr:SDR family oxidoreductase [Zoogloeaceae bacterium]
MSALDFPAAFTLTGKTILITGASSGIGSQIARECARAGACIIASGRNEERLSNLLHELPELPSSAHRAIVCDLGDADQIGELVRQAGKIQGVVHSAGVSMLAPLRMASRRHIEDQLAVNVVGPMLLTGQLLARNAIESGGAILFISSISAHIGVHGVSAYSASKAALEAMARSLAMETAKKKIRVNCLAPGLVETPMLEAARQTAGGLEETQARYPLGFGRPEDVAYAAIFLLSDASRWITGTTLILDGGHTVGR